MASQAFDLTQLRNHDESEWTAFYDYFTGRLYHFARRYSTAIDEAIAQDIVQDTLLTAYEEICTRKSELRADGQYLITWVYGICKNRCRDTVKGARRREAKGDQIKVELTVHTEAQERPSDPSETDRVLHYSGIAECLDCLPSPDAGELVLNCLLPYAYDTLEILVECLNKSSPALRAALLLRYIAGLQYREIADLLDISLEAVKGRLHTGAPLFRQRVQQHYAGTVPIQGQGVEVQ
jgi:RNA polymerase sigma factor (sigma-70 family)